MTILLICLVILESDENYRNGELNMLADTGTEIAIMILSPWILANLLGFIALTFSFTRLRHTFTAIVCGLTVVTFGLYLTFATPVLKGGVAPIHVMSWCPVLCGAITLLRWRPIRKHSNA